MRSGYSVTSLFHKGNVGVIEKEQKHLIAFRSVEPGPSTESASNPSIGYHLLSKYMKEFIWDTCHVSPSEIPKQMESYFDDLEEESVDENFIAQHPFTMTNLLYADTCVQLYWFLKKDIDTVLSAIGAKLPDVLWTTLSHEFLRQFLPKPLKKKYAAKKYRGLTKQNLKQQLSVLAEIQRGNLAVEICRHCTMHSMDADIQQLVSKRLNISSYTRDEMTEVLCIAYDDILKTAYYQLMLLDKWDKLRVKERSLLPSIYQAPASGMIDLTVVVVILQE